MKNLLLILFFLCAPAISQAQESRVIPGDEQTSEYFPILKGKQIAVFSNHTGMLGNKHGFIWELSDLMPERITHSELL